MSRLTDGGETHPREDAPFAFFALVVALSVPFWALGAALGGELMPGLPLASLMILAPTLAAVILRLRRGGPAGATALLARAVDVRRMGPAGVVALLLIIHPALFVASFLIQRGLGVAAPAPDIALAPTLSLLAVFLIAGLCEELGWTGYALEPLQRRWGPLGASLIIGTVWAAWHFIPLAQAGRSLDWIAWWALGTLASRMIMVWLYNRVGRSVFAVSLYHALSNLAWQVYPVHGSYFDPRIGALLASALAVVLLQPWRRKRGR